MKRCFQCPHCKCDAIPLKAKYLAGVWQVIHCPACRGRLCANPIILALAYIAYCWAFAWFAFSAAFQGSLLPLLYLIPVWLVLDFLNVNLIPLSRMKPRPGQA